MGLLRRLEALEGRLGAQVARCEECGGPGGVRVVLLDEGQELGECEACAGQLGLDGKPVGMVMADGVVRVQVIVLHAAG